MELAVVVQSPLGDPSGTIGASVRQKALGKISDNSLRPKQNWRHFADNSIKCIFLNKNRWIPIKMSPKFVPSGPIKTIPEESDNGLAPSRRQAIIWTNDG